MNICRIRCPPSNIKAWREDSRIQKSAQNPMPSQIKLSAIFIELAILAFILSLHSNIVLKEFAFYFLSPNRIGIRIPYIAMGFESGFGIDELSGLIIFHYTVDSDKWPIVNR
jgi:hypothetical protein